jgi:hypothetical protein
VRRGKLARVVTASVIGLLLPSAALAKAASGKASQTISPPYHETATIADDTCSGVSGNPYCEEDAYALTDGSLGARALISDSSRLASDSGSGSADAAGFVTHYINIGTPGNDPKDKGRRLTVTLRVAVPRVAVRTTTGNRAQVFLFARVSMTCLTPSFDDCQDSRQVSVADTSGTGSECPEACTITLTIQAPPDRPLGGGFIQLALVAKSDLTRESSVLPEVHNAEASADVRLASIQLQQS